jgi:hypothetical protein
MCFVSFVLLLCNGGWMLCVSYTFHSVVFPLWLITVLQLYYGYFPYQFSFHRLLHTHYLSSRIGKIGQVVADVPSGLSLTPPQDSKRNAWQSAFWEQWDPIPQFDSHYRKQLRSRLQSVTVQQPMQFYLECSLHKSLKCNQNRTCRFRENHRSVFWSTFQGPLFSELESLHPPHRAKTSSG